MNISIAIDGPSGAGKSTVADDVAAKLGILHLDTGAMYRAFAWYALQEGVDSLDEKALTALAENTRIEVAFENGGQKTLVNGTDVTGLIRTQEISMAASNVSKFEEGRRFMVRMQQTLAQTQSMILDGRDIGTTVLPGAPLKIFLTASPEARAQRRFAELSAKGESDSYEKVLEDVKRRDLQDTTREVEPLRPAEDAVELDTSHMTKAEVVEKILALLGERGIGGEEKAKALPETQPKAEKPAPTGKKKRFSWLYWLVARLSGLIFRVFLPVKYHHLENTEIDAPFILIANHNSMLDPLIAAWKIRRYQLRFFGKKELVRNKFFKAIFDNIGMIPVDRHNMDMAAIRACMKALKEGNPLCFFPEGTRHKQGIMQDLESGIAIIALKGNVPLLPAYIADKPRLFRRNHCYFGAPISVEEMAKGGCGNENCERLLGIIRSTYEDFVAEHEAFISKK